MLWVLKRTVWYSKELSGTQKNRLNEMVLLSNGGGSFEHPKHMLKLMGKKILTTLHSKIMFI